MLTTFKTSASNLEQIPRVSRATVLAITSTAPWPLRRKQGLLPIARIDASLTPLRCVVEGVELAVQAACTLHSVCSVWWCVAYSEGCGTRNRTIITELRKSSSALQ